MKYAKNETNRPPKKEEFQIKKSDLKNVLKKIYPAWLVKQFQDKLDAMWESLKWVSTTVVKTKSGDAKDFEYSILNHDVNPENVIIRLYPSGKVSVNGQPVVCGDLVHQLSKVL